MTRQFKKLAHSLDECKSHLVFCKPTGVVERVLGP